MNIANRSVHLLWFFIPNIRYLTENLLFYLLVFYFRGVSFVIFAVKRLGLLWHFTTSFCGIPLGIFAIKPHWAKRIEVNCDGWRMLQDWKDTSYSAYLHSFFTPRKKARLRACSRAFEYSLEPPLGGLLSLSSSIRWCRRADRCSRASWAPCRRQTTVSPYRFCPR